MLILPIAKSFPFICSVCVCLCGCMYICVVSHSCIYICRKVYVNASTSTLMCSCGIYIYVYMCVFVHLCMHTLCRKVHIIGTSTVVWAGRVQTTSPVVILMNHRHMSEGLSLTEILILPIRLDCLSSESLESSCPHLPNAKIKDTQQNPQFLRSVRKQTKDLRLT